MDTTNSVIKQIADRFGCGYCRNEKLTNPIYSMYVDKSGYETIHYNGLGYAVFTEMLIENIGNMDEEYMKCIIPPTVS